MQVTANQTDVVYVELDPVVWPKGVPVDTPPIEKYKVPDSNRKFFVLSTHYF